MMVYTLVCLLVSISSEELVYATTETPDCFPLMALKEWDKKQLDRS